MRILHCSKTNPTIDIPACLRDVVLLQAGKLVVISDVLDQNRALIDRPDEIRRVESFRRLSLTDFKIDIPRLAKKSVLKAKLAETDVFKKFASSAWGKKLALRTTKANQTDFDRYKASIAKAKRSRVIRKALYDAKKKTKPAAKKK